MNIIYKIYKQFSRTLILFLALLIIFVNTGSVFAGTLSDSEIKSLNNYTNWVSSECSTGLSGIGGGSGLIDGAVFPNTNPTSMANAINQWLVKYYPNSQFKEDGDLFVKDGKSANINPLLLVAISVNESGAGTTTRTDSSWLLANNAFGRTVAVDQNGNPNTTQPHVGRWYKWNTPKDSIDPKNANLEGGGDMASYLRNQFGSKIDSNNMVQFAEGYDSPDPTVAQDYLNKLNASVNQLISLSTGQAGLSSGQDASQSNPCQSANYSCPSTAGAVSGSSVSESVRQKVVCIAEGELAIWSSQSGYPWTGENTYALTGYLKYSQNAHELWCADFASWVYNQANYPITGSKSQWRLAGVYAIAMEGQNSTNFSYHDSSSNYAPKPGDLTIYDFKQSGYDHVDIVVAVNGNNVTTIGGDSGHGPFPGGSIVSKGTKIGFYTQGVRAYVSPK